jgi:hypothetical protein
MPAGAGPDDLALFVLPESRARRYPHRRNVWTRPCAEKGASSIVLSIASGTERASRGGGKPLISAAGASSSQACPDYPP